MSFSRAAVGLSLALMGCLPSPRGISTDGGPMDECRDFACVTDGGPPCHPSTCPKLNDPKARDAAPETDAPVDAAEPCMKWAEFTTTDGSLYYLPVTCAEAEAIHRANRAKAKREREEREQELLRKGGKSI